MQVSLGGTYVRLALLTMLISSSVLAGCLGGPTADSEQEVEIGEGEGLVTLWMSRPTNAMEYNVQALSAVPRFIAFTADGEDTITRINNTKFIDVTEGWTDKEGGWPDGEYPKSARKNWLYEYDVWYQGTVPVGNYSSIRIEVIDQRIILGNSHPDLYIGNTQESTGYPRLTFQPDPEVGMFKVEEGEELVLNFQTTLDFESRTTAVIH